MSLTLCLTRQARYLTVKSVFRTAVTTRHVSYSALRVKQDRLMVDIHHTCQWGTGQRWGE